MGRPRHPVAQPARDLHGPAAAGDARLSSIDWGYRADGIPVRLFDAWTTLPAGPATLAAKTGSRILPDRDPALGRRADLLDRLGEPIEVAVADPAALQRATQAHRRRARGVDRRRRPSSGTRSSRSGRSIPPRATRSRRAGRADAAPERPRDRARPRRRRATARARGIARPAAPGAPRRPRSPALLITILPEAPVNALGDRGRRALVSRRARPGGAGPPEPTGAWPRISSTTASPTPRPRPRRPIRRALERLVRRDLPPGRALLPRHGAAARAGARPSSTGG